MTETEKNTHDCELTDEDLVAGIALVRALLGDEDAADLAPQARAQPLRCTVFSAAGPAGATSAPLAASSSRAIAPRSICGLQPPQ